MSNLYKNYLKERENLDVIECEHGFIAFRFDDNHCYISDYYVEPSERRSGLGYWLADQVLIKCKEKGIPMVMCQSDASGPNHNVSMGSILNYGFKLYNKEGNLHHYFMEVEKWERK